MTWTDHTRWGWGPVRGAYAPSGGHWKAFGFCYYWLPRAEYDKTDEWTPQWEFEIFGVFCIKHEPGLTRWSVGRVELKFTPARWRIGKREEARARRQARHRYAAALKAARI